MFNQTLLLDYRYKACVPGIKRQVVEMAINGSSIRDTGRVLGINKNTALTELMISNIKGGFHPKFEKNHIAEL